MWFIRRALDDTIAEVSLPTSDDDINFDVFVESRRQQIFAILEEQRRLHGSIRLHVRASARFVREVEGDVQRAIAHFHTSPQLVSSAADVDFESILTSINAQPGHINERGSGFNTAKVAQFELVVTKFRPFHGNSCIPTPTFLLNKKCIVNVQNSWTYKMTTKNASCGRFCHACTNRHEISVTKCQQYLDTLNVQGLGIPLSPKPIPLFEKLNPEISVSLYSFDQDDERAFNIEYVSPHRHRPHHVNLSTYKTCNSTTIIISWLTFFSWRTCLNIFLEMYLMI